MGEVGLQGLGEQEAVGGQLGVICRVAGRQGERVLTEYTCMKYELT